MTSPEKEEGDDIGGEEVAESVENTDDDSDDRKPAAIELGKDDGKEKKARGAVYGEPVGANPEVVEKDTTALEPKASPSLQDSHIISSLDRTPEDILCGRGMPFQSYPGNIAMHDVVNQHKDEYISCRRSDKPRVIKTIIRQLKNTGARFLKPYGEFQSNDSDRWTKVDEQYIYDKISHVMRHRQRAARGAVAEASSSRPGWKGVANSAAFGEGTSGSLTSSSSSSTPAIGSEGLRNLLSGGGVGGGVASLSPGSGQPSNVDSLLAQILQNRTPPPAAVPVAVADQKSLLQALIQSERASLLSKLGLANQQQPSLLYHGHNLHLQNSNQHLLQQAALGMQQQQQALQQQHQQSLVEQALVAQLQQQQLQQEIQNQRLLAAAARLRPPVMGHLQHQLQQRQIQQQQGNTAILSELPTEEIQRQLLLLLAQNQGKQQPQSES